MDNMTLSPIKRAAELCGGFHGLAKLCGITVQAVYKWDSAGRIPPERCLTVEHATSGAVTRYDLRPDVFGQAPDSLPTQTIQPEAA